MLIPGQSFHNSNQKFVILSPAVVHINTLIYSLLPSAEKEIGAVSRKKKKKAGNFLSLLLTDFGYIGQKP